MLNPATERFKLVNGVKHDPEAVLTCGWESISRLQEHIRPSVDTVIKLLAFWVPTTFTQYTGCYIIKEHTKVQTTWKYIKIYYNSLRTCPIMDTMEMLFSWAIIQGKVPDVCSGSLLKLGTSMPWYANTDNCVNVLCRYCGLINFCFSPQNGLFERTDGSLSLRSGHTLSLSRAWEFLNLQHVRYSGTVCVAEQHNGAYALLWALPQSCALCPAWQSLIGLIDSEWDEKFNFRLKSSSWIKGHSLVAFSSSNVGLRVWG